MTRAVRALSHPVSQIAISIALAAGVTFFMDAINFRSLFNAVWMVGIPCLVSLAMNEGWARRVTMALVLFIASTLAIVVIGSLFTRIS